MIAVSLVLLLFEPALAQNNDYNTRAVDCPDGTRGYNSLASLQQDIDDERARVLGGDSAAAQYQFTLCPDQNYPVSDPLVPALDNIVIGCGDNLDVMNNCRFDGGNVQVDVQSFQDSSFPVQAVTLQGITYQNFNDAALAGSATSATEVFLSSTSFEVSKTRCEQRGSIDK